MRVLKTAPDDSFRVKAYAGTNGVLLAFDLTPERRAGCLGFAIEQKEAGKQWQYLLNSLTFPDRAHTLPKWNATPTDLAPIQKFRWADYTIEPGVTCQYRVRPVYGSADEPRPDDASALTLTVKTDDGKPADHRVIFNRAVAASQAFGRKFPDVDALLSTNKDLPIEDWPEAARAWLEHGLLDQIMSFVARAKDERWALDVAIYEYELKAIVDAVLAAHRRKVDVRVIYHSKSGDHQTSENEASLERIPVKRKRARVTSKIFHHKFMVLSKVNAAGKRVPQAVLAGSTNFTENGVYRQANVVHVIDDKRLAGQYLDLFDCIWETPDHVATTRTWIDSNNAIDQGSKCFAGFSPRSGRVDLAEIIRAIDGAERDLLFATAFKLPEDVLDAILGQPHDPVLRYGIQNSASRITGFHADRTADFTTPALLSRGLEGWVKEGLRGQRGNLLIHTKAVVVDFTSDAPTIVSGSHNLSEAASKSNDENFLILRGDTDLADRYGIELLRFYEHYRFRYYARKLKLKEVRPLTVDDSWSDDYYEPGNLKEAARLRFAGRE